MVLDQVWDNFIKVLVLLFIVGSLLTYHTCQSDPASSPFNKKGFPLYDVLATGASTFWGTGMESGELDGEGSVEEEGEEDEQEDGEDELALSQVSWVSLATTC